MIKRDKLRRTQLRGDKLTSGKNASVATNNEALDSLRRHKERQRERERAKVFDSKCANKVAIL